MVLLMPMPSFVREKLHESGHDRDEHAQANHDGEGGDPKVRPAKRGKGGNGGEEQKHGDPAPAIGIVELDGGHGQEEDGEGGEGDFCDHGASET